MDETSLSGLVAAVRQDVFPSRTAVAGPWIAVGIVLVLIALVPLLSRAVRRWASRLQRLHVSGTQGRRRLETIVAFVRSVAYFSLAIMLVFFTLHALLPDFNPLAATGALSIVALILTGMFKDVVVDVVKGLDILLGAHYDVGDYIEVAGMSGHVVDFQLKYTKLRSASGEEVILNNAKCIPSKRFPHGRVTHYVCIPLTQASDAGTAREAIDRAGAELNQEVEAVQHQPRYQQTLPLPITGGVLLQYQVDLLPGNDSVIADRYVPLIQQALAQAKIALAREITHFPMNDMETFHRLFNRRVREEEIRGWSAAADHDTRTDGK